MYVHIPAARTLRVRLCIDCFVINLYMLLNQLGHLRCDSHGQNTCGIEMIFRYQMPRSFLRGTPSEQCQRRGVEGLWWCYKCQVMTPADPAAGPMLEYFFACSRPASSHFLTISPLLFDIALRQFQVEPLQLYEPCSSTVLARLSRGLSSPRAMWRTCYWSEALATTVRYDSSNESVTFSHDYEWWIWMNEYDSIYNDYERWINNGHLRTAFVYIVLYSWPGGPDNDEPWYEVMSTMMVSDWVMCMAQFHIDYSPLDGSRCNTRDSQYHRLLYFFNNISN